MKVIIDSVSTPIRPEPEPARTTNAGAGIKAGFTYQPKPDLNDVLKQIIWTVQGFRHY